jgi:hypothetical protein
LISGENEESVHFALLILQLILISKYHSTLSQYFLISSRISLNSSFVSAFILQVKETVFSEYLAKDTPQPSLLGLLYDLIFLLGSE